MKDYDDDDDEKNFADSEDDNWEPDEKKSTKKSSKRKSDAGAAKAETPKEKKKNSQLNQKAKKCVPKQNDTRTVESLLMKNNFKYLVKWANCSDDENTWEHKTAIPKMIVKVNMEILDTPPKLSVPLFLSIIGITHHRTVFFSVRISNKTTYCHT